MAASLMNMLDDLEARLERTQAELQALREENKLLKQQLALQEGQQHSGSDPEIDASAAIQRADTSEVAPPSEPAKTSAESSNGAIGLMQENTPTESAPSPAKAPTPHALLNQWYERYPKAFFKGHTKPLKVGIHQDLAEREEWPNKLIRRALANYVNLPRYVKAVRAGVERVDLDGLPAGKVDKEAALHASEKRGDQKEKHADQKEKRGDKRATGQPKKTQPTPTPATTKPRPHAAEPPAAEKSEPRKPLSMEDKLLDLQQKFKGR